MVFFVAHSWILDGSFIVEKQPFLDMKAMDKESNHAIYADTSSEATIFAYENICLAILCHLFG